MQKTIITLICLVSLTSLRPGVPLATLTCKSESGRTFFTAELPECRFLVKGEFSIDGSKLNFGQTDFSSIIFDSENKVFTMGLQSDPNPSKKTFFLQLWAIPSTIKKIKSEKGSGSQFHDIYEFKAKIYATEPRKGFDNNTKIIELNCTLDYQL
jgi:hypothetical protein